RLRDRQAVAVHAPVLVEREDRSADKRHDEILELVQRHGGRGELAWPPQAARGEAERRVEQKRHAPVGEQEEDHGPPQRAQLSIRTEHEARDECHDRSPLRHRYWPGCPRPPARQPGRERRKLTYPARNFFSCSSTAASLMPPVSSNTF